MSLLTVSEVAKIMRVKPCTVRRASRRGELKTVKIGRQLRFPIDQFAEFIDVDKYMLDLRAEVREVEDAVDELL